MPRKNTKHTFTQNLLDLISEPQFLRFENTLSEPNIFKIVGRTHYERWHSCFLGWLLDPNGSHLLSTYVLTRFLILLLDERSTKAKGHSTHALLSILPTVEFVDVEVVPNEYLSSETSVDGVGRFDIYVTAKYHDNLGNHRNLNMLVELKIDSKPQSEQSKKYADWLQNTHPEDANLLVYLTPSVGDDSKATVGDDRWYCLDYQLLNDKLLFPILDHPNLNEKVRPFIVQYVKNLRIRYRGIKMAITDEEKNMALALYEKYSEVFDSIYDVLKASGAIDFSTSEVPGRKGRTSGKIAVKIDDKMFSNLTLRQLFEDVLKYLVDTKYILRIPLPWGNSPQRYIITNDSYPMHPNGREFFYPVKYGGYTLESHYARERGLKVLSDLCDKLEIGFEVIDTEMHHTSKHRRSGAQ